MTDIQLIFKEYGPQYKDLFKEHMPKNHIKTIDAIISCRTAASGVVVYDCTGCGQVHVTYRSCGNHYCNICQGHKTRQWLENRLDRQLPGHHFMITFTIPEQLRYFFRSHQCKAYNAMFEASSQTLKAFAADPKYIGGDLPGFFGVLHTWGRQLQFHPHIHYVVLERKVHDSLSHRGEGKGGG
ncbi:MAG: transposase zinc-binding domain-containing protein [Bacteroidales bacterium]